MDIYKVKWTRLQSEIFRFLCIKSGQSLNVRSIARSLKVSPTAVSNAIVDLEKEGLVKIEISKLINLHLIKFNRDNKRAIELKRLENMKMIYESGLSADLYGEFPGCTIILFGSFSKGEDSWINDSVEGRSDIDIAIIGTKGKDLNLAKFDKILERTVTINFYRSWKDIHKNLKDNILNGIVLSGGIQL